MTDKQLLENLKLFFNAAMERATEFDGMDGEDIKEKGVELGLLRKEIYDPAIHGNSPLYDWAIPGEDEIHVINFNDADNKSSGWNKVSEVPPPEDEWILVASKSCVYTGIYRDDLEILEIVGATRIYERSLSEITHWMPKPELPDGV